MVTKSLMVPIYYEIVASKITEKAQKIITHHEQRAESSVPENQGDRPQSETEVESRTRRLKALLREEQGHILPDHTLSGLVGYDTLERGRELAYRL